MKNILARFLHNLREGFATNSSSTHSLVRWAGARPTPESGDDPGGGYGWDWFLLTRPEVKQHYLQTALFEQLSNELDPEEAAKVIHEVWPEKTAEEHRRSLEGAYIDHDSRFYFPTQWDGKTVDLDFVRAIKDLFNRTDIAVYGGNDNDSDPGIDEGWKTINRTDSLFSGGIVRKDNKYGYWTIFSRIDGTKQRLAFDEPWNEKVVRAECSEVPELVDLKITDYCSFGCKFCYQGSTTQGQHAPKERIFKVLDSLAAMKVFEVAIGGGEPTEHPDLPEILRYAKSKGLVANFTTRNLDWLKLHPEVFELIGAVAISVNSAAEVQRVCDAFAPQGPCTRKLIVQYIIGQHSDRHQLEDILDCCGLNSMPITLLGYKMTGRGAQFGRRDMAIWAQIVADKVKKYNYWRLAVGIDTVLAHEGRVALMELGADPRTMTFEEGQHSCYIDAVQMQLHESSYTGREGTPIDGSLESIKAAWEGL